MDFYCGQGNSQNSQFSVQSSQYGGQMLHGGMSLSTGCQSSGKSHNKRRSWSMLEEKVLLGAFQEIMAQGWKTQNGFRNGFLNVLESKMRQQIPGTDLRGEPHIASKYGSWKKTYRDVTQVLSQSGFNWISASNTVDALPSTWDSYCQAHPTYAYVREKPFPMYEVWVDIYGKDRANGNGAMDFEGRRSDSPPAPPPPPQTAPAAATSVNEHEDTHEHVPRYQNGGLEEEIAQSEKSTTPPGTATRKRKRIEQTEEVIELISGMWSKATDSLEKVVVRIGHDVDEAEKRSKLYELIGQLPMVITLAEQLDAAYELCMNEKAMDMFFGLPDVAKCGLVQKALEGKLK